MDNKNQNRYNFGLKYVEGLWKHKHRIQNTSRQIMCKSHDNVLISYVCHTSHPSILADNRPHIPLLPCHIYLALHSGRYILPDSHIQNYQQGKLLKIHVYA